MTSQERLRNRIGQEFVKMRWVYRGCSFFAESYHRVEGLRITCRFESKLDYIRIELKIENTDFADAEFRGEECFLDAITWASGHITGFTDRYAKNIQANMYANLSSQLKQARFDYVCALLEANPPKE